MIEGGLAFGVLSSFFSCPRDHQLGPSFVAVGG